MLHKQTLLENFKTKNLEFLFIMQNNSIYNYFFYCLLFILILFVYNIVINNLVKINLFNKKHFFYLNKKRQLTEIFLKFLKKTIFLNLYKLIVIKNFV